MKKLSVSETAGMDSVCAEHPKVRFTAFIVHYVIDLGSCCQGEEGKVGCTDDRPVALARTLSEVIEQILVEMIKKL